MNHFDVLKLKAKLKKINWI